MNVRVPTWIPAPPAPATPVASDDPAGPDGAGGREAVGVPEADGGPAGNTRLTAATGMVLFLLLALEGVTLLGVRQILTLHVVVGALLLGPVLLKSGSTLYRFGRYYTGAEPYRRKGPPPRVLRVIGPLVILSTLALLGTGVALVLTGPTGSGVLLTAHQASFWVWFGLMTVHVVGHVWEAAVVSWRELRAWGTGRDARGRRWRLVAVGLALMAGVGVATALVPSAAPWVDRPAHHAAPAATVRP